MTQVTKRDKEIAEFSLNKIIEVIKKAFKATKKDYNNEILELLSLKVTVDFQNKMEDGRISVEETQNSVEHALERIGYTDVAKAYILYEKQRERIRNMNSATLDYKDVVDSYAKVEDWCVEENSTVTHSVGGLILSNLGVVTVNYWPSEIYDQEIADAHHNAGVHLHDLPMFTGYCAGWSPKQLLMEGLGGITGRITPSPTKHLSVLRNQMVNFLGIMQNEWAGTQASSSFNTYFTPLVKVDNLSYPEVKKCIESFIYGANTPSRWGIQALLSNITLGWTTPNDMAEPNAIVSGREVDFRYKDCKAEVDMINKAFIETMAKGDVNGRGFQYPIPIYSITRDFDQSETENSKLLFEMTSKYGIPCSSNHINSDMEPSDVRSMCCRPCLDLHGLRKKTGGFFGSGESTGPVGVVTINIPRITYLAKDEADFYEKLDHMMDIPARSPKIKRQVITRLLNQGFYLYIRRYLGTFEDHLSTIGLIGMNEAGPNAKWVRKDLTSRECQKFTQDVLNHTRERLSDYQEMYGDLYNLEVIPVGSISYRLAKRDRARYPEIITAGGEGETPYCTNSSHLSVNYTANVFGVLDIQDELQPLCTSGIAFHAFLGEKLPDWKAAANLVRTTTENYKPPYYTMPPTYSICKSHGYLIGEHFTCPICGRKAEVHSRIMGYHRPVQNWSEDKIQEYKDRTSYDIGRSKLKHRVSRIVTGGAVKPAQPGQVKSKKVSAPAQLYLFTAKTCPSCRSTKELLKGWDYQVVDAEERPELAEKFGIMQVPTLVIARGGIIQRFVSASSIHGFVEQKDTDTMKAQG